MKVSIKRGGGFAGISEEIASLDTATLNQAAASEVENLVRSANFFDLPSSPPGQRVGADFLKYEVTVTDAGRQHTLIFNDDGAPTTARLREFVERVAKLQ
jgi:hypothetical protein